MEPPDSLQIRKLPGERRVEHDHESVGLAGSPDGGLYPVRTRCVSNNAPSVAVRRRCFPGLDQDADERGLAVDDEQSTGRRILPCPHRFESLGLGELAVDALLHVGGEAGGFEVDAAGARVLERVDDLAVEQLVDGHIHDLVLGRAEVATASLFEDLRAAIDRGVSVAVGTIDESLKDRIQAELPEARVFVSRLEWLAEGDPTASSYEAEIGRLLLADRETILASTVSTDDGTATSVEQAVVGRGFTNGFIVIARRLLDRTLPDRGSRCPRRVRGPRTPSRCRSTARARTPSLAAGWRSSRPLRLEP